MLRLVYVMLLIFALPVMGVAQHFAVKKLVGRDTSVKFPFFESSKNSAAAKRINTLLFATELEIPAGVPVRYIDDSVGVDSGYLSGGTVSLEYKIVRNDARLLSLGMSQSSSGATMYYWTNYYTFNAANGKRVTIKELFTQEGYKKFRKAVRAAGRRKIDEQKGKALEDPQDRYGQVDELKGYFEVDNNLDFYITEHSICINQSAHSSKWLMFSEWDLELKFEADKLLPWLSTYGKSVFAKGSVAANK